MSDIFPKEQEEEKPSADVRGAEFYSASDMSEADPNWTGLWPEEPPRQADAHQMPPRAWPPDQFGAAHVPFIPEPYEPETAAEDLRRSGLAWSVGIMFFSSVAFMLFLGWIADYLLGTSPFGIVAGVVVGSAIGFFQVFRITSQMYKPSRQRNEIRTLMSATDDDSDNFPPRF